eukprot:2332757-Rhodomonas_salina.1
MASSTTTLAVGLRRVTMVLPTPTPGPVGLRVRQRAKSKRAATDTRPPMRHAMKAMRTPTQVVWAPALPSASCRCVGTVCRHPMRAVTTEA